MKTVPFPRPVIRPVLDFSVQFRNAGQECRLSNRNCFPARCSIVRPGKPNLIANTVSSGGNVSTRTTGTGLVVVDSFQNLIASNDEAIQILAFPVHPNQMRRPWPLLKEKVDACLRNGHSGNGSGSAHEFRSGKRTYLCRSFTLKISA